MKPNRRSVQEADLKDIEKAWEEIKKGEYEEATPAKFLRELRKK